MEESGAFSQGEKGETSKVRTSLKLHRTLLVLHHTLAVLQKRLSYDDVSLSPPWCICMGALTNSKMIIEFIFLLLLLIRKKSKSSRNEQKKESLTEASHN
jgi:hypothetical protein